MTDLRRERQELAELISTAQRITAILDPLSRVHLIDLCNAVSQLEQARDALVAYAHGGPLPELTPGAQALLVRQTDEETR